MDREKRVVEIKMIVSIEAVDFDDAVDMLTEVFGNIDDLGVECLSIAFKEN